jgi:hypothetical protein
VAFLVFRDQQTADRVVADIEVTANIEGGAGAVKLGTLARLPDGRPVAAHRFEAVDLDWIAIYADDPGLEVVVQLP